MAQDIVPIRLGLTEGDVVTLWAPRWREGGEEWEAFLGHGEHLYGFTDAAELAAFVRTADEHDLTDHPAWHLVPQLGADELVPDENHHYDLVGVPAMVAEDPDTWSVGDLADVMVMVRSLADVCELEAVHEVLNAADGFALLDQGAMVFTGREGERLWTEMATVVAERWDEVLDAIDALVTKPDVDASTLDAARAELAAAEAAEAQAAAAASTQDDAAEGEAEASDEGDAERAVSKAEAAEAEGADEDEEDEEPAAPLGFWEQVGIDPILIVTTTGDHYTLRCYVDDEPLFLGSDGTIEVFRSHRALAKYLATGEGGEHGHDLAGVSTWPEVVEKATAGELVVKVAPENTYVLAGLADDLVGGPETVDPNQLELAVELVSDAAEWAGDQSVAAALAPSESLGWLVSFVLRPDPTRLAPSPPFDAEVAAWKKLANGFVDRLHVN